jgi:hypothetical protein
MAAFASPVPAAIPETVNPGLKIVNLRTDNTFEPMVTGLGFLSDGRLVVCHWGGLHAAVDKLQTAGKVYIIKGVTGDTPAPAVSTFAESLEDPVGMLVKDDKIYITGGEKLSELPDANNDGKAEAPRVICRHPCPARIPLRSRLQGRQVLDERVLGQGCRYRPSRLGAEESQSRHDHVGRPGYRGL